MLIFILIDNEGFGHWIENFSKNLVHFSLIESDGCRFFILFTGGLHVFLEFYYKEFIKHFYGE